MITLLKNLSSGGCVCTIMKFNPTKSCAISAYYMIAVASRYMAQQLLQHSKVNAPQVPRNK